MNQLMCVPEKFTFGLRDFQIGLDHQLASGRSRNNREYHSFGPKIHQMETRESFGVALDHSLFSVKLSD